MAKQIELSIGLSTHAQITTHGWPNHGVIHTNPMVRVHNDDDNNNIELEKDNNHNHNQTNNNNNNNHNNNNTHSNNNNHHNNTNNHSNNHNNSNNSTRVEVEVTLEVKSDSVRVSRVAQKGYGGEVGFAVGPERTEKDRDRETDRGRKGEREAGSCSANGAVLAKSVSSTEHALQGLRFINEATVNKDPDAMWQQTQTRFTKLASPNGFLARADFASCIGMNDSKEFAMEVLDALTRRRGIRGKIQCISKNDLYKYWLQITDRSFSSRTQLFFDLCDKDSDGRIAEEEVKQVILLSASANKLSILHEKADEYAALIMEELDSDNQGYIEISQLEALFRGGREVESETFPYTLNQSGNAITLSPFHWQSPLRKARRKVRHVLHENWRRIWVIALWVAAMAMLFVWKFLQYKNRRGVFEIMGYCVCTAKGAAETLKLNMALILIPVCRNTLTWFRSTFMDSILSFDDNIRFHKIVAGAIGVGVVIHGIAHIGCDFPRIADSDYRTFENAIGRNFGRHQPSLWEILVSPEVVSGIAMTGLMLVAFLLAIHAFRKSSIKIPWPFHFITGFNAFWYSHHLFVLVYILLIFHSMNLFLTHSWNQKTTWIYLAVPLSLYCGERILRSVRACQFNISLFKASIYEGDVLALYMNKPNGFQYKSGMYIFLQCPDISSLEWHPFSLTSAPGDDYLSLHIRANGDWTTELMITISNVLVGQDRDKPLPSSRFPKLLIDGPYGAPSQKFKKYDIMLLIGLGIGATPFVSILKDILYSLRSFDRRIHNNLKENQHCPSNAQLSLEKEMRRKKIYFYWVTREQSSFSWFKDVLDEVAEIDKKEVLEMHNHLTSVYEEGDARSALITMVQALNHARNGVDIVSGTRVCTHFARPNWWKVFSRLSAKHPGATIGVFYCGSSILSKELSTLCSKFTYKSRTKFIFHKENF